MIQLNNPVTLHTDGNTSYWSDRAADVSVTAFGLPYLSPERDFGELRVYFDTDSWDVNQHGLIYTDKTFLKELSKLLTSMGLAGRDVTYSEQGMQGDDYVSCDVGEDFIASWQKKFTVTV